MWLLLKDLDCNNFLTCNLTWTLLGPWTSRLKTFLPSQAEDYCCGEIPDIKSENLGFKDPRSMNEGLQCDEVDSINVPQNISGRCISNSINESVKRNYLYEYGRNHLHIFDNE